MVEISGVSNEASNANRLRQQSVVHTLRPMSMQDEKRTELPSILTKGEGVYVTDIDGRRMIDCVGGLWCVNAGYGRREIIHAMTAQLERLSFASTFPGTANVPSIQLAEKICQIAKPERIAKVFFGSNGSDAVENALKIARQYWKIKGKVGKYKILSFRGAYHGTHFGGMSTQGGGGIFKAYEPLLGGFYSVETYDAYRPLIGGLDSEQLADLYIEILRREIVHHGAGTIAAFIAEPVQGAGGMHQPPQSYWTRVRQLCDENDILLISDEVVTGFGRSGSMFGIRGRNVLPDIMCCGKGISGGYSPLSATLITENVAQAWSEENEYSFVGAGYTQGGNPVSCAAGLAALDIVVNERLDENAKNVGEYLLRKLSVLPERHAVVGDVRGKGLMINIEMVKDQKTKEPCDHHDPLPDRVSKICQENGVWLRQMGHKFILSPPLILTREHADQVAEVLDHAYTKAAL